MFQICTSFLLRTFEVLCAIWDLLETPDGNVVVCEWEPREDTYRINKYTQSGHKCHRTLYLPVGSKTFSMAALGEVFVAADRNSSRLHVINFMGQQVGNVQLPVNPRSITSVGRRVWMYCRDGQIHYTDIGDNNRALETHGVEFEKYRGGVDNITANSNRVGLCYEGANIVKVYDHDGKSLFTYGSVEQSGDQQLKRPCDVCFDDKDNIYIADYCNTRIVIVGPDGKLIGYLPTQHEPFRLHVSNTTLYVATNKDVSISIYKLKWT